MNTDTKTLSDRLRARAKSQDEGGDAAAAERAMMGMEAQSDLWAERINLNDIIKNLVHVNRLDPGAPSDVREKFIKRQAEQFDALLRQSFLEGYMEGGISRQAYDRDLDDSTADALDAKDALLREAANVMRPIAAIADAVFAKYEDAPGIFREANSGRPDCQAVWGFDRADLTYGDLRRARALLSKLTEATKP